METNRCTLIQVHARLFKAMKAQGDLLNLLTGAAIILKSLIDSSKGETIYPVIKRDVKKLLKNINVGGATDDYLRLQAMTKMACELCKKEQEIYIIGGND